MTGKQIQNDVDNSNSIVILLAVWMAEIVMGIYLYAYGYFHLILLETYGEGDFKTGLVGTLNTSLLCFLAPVASIVMNRYSARVAICCGGLLIATGCLLSAFMPNIIGIILCYGIISGVGNAIAGIPMFLVAGFYFERHRDFVISSVPICTAIGMFLSTPVVSYLTNEYGIHGAYMILSACALHLCALGLLCKPSSVELKLLRIRDDVEIRVDTLKEEVDEIHVMNVNDGDLDNTLDVDIRIDTLKEGVDEIHSINVNEGDLDNTLDVEKRVDTLKEGVDEIHVINVNDGDVDNTLGVHNSTESAVRMPSNTKSKIKTFFNPAFILFLVSTSAWNVSFSTTQLHLPSFLNTHSELKQQIETIMVLFGIGNATGRLTSAIISINGSNYGLEIYITTMLVAGCTSFGFPWYSEFVIGGYIFAFVIGFATGAPQGFMASIIVSIAGIKSLSTGFGIAFFFCGLGVLTGPNIASLILYVFGGYRMVFVTTGCISLAGSICSVLTKIILHRNKN